MNRDSLYKVSAPGVMPFCTWAINDVDAYNTLVAFFGPISLEGTSFEVVSEVPEGLIVL